MVAPDSISGWGNCPSAWLSFDRVDDLVLDGHGELDARGSVWWAKASNITLDYHPTDILVSTFIALCAFIPRKRRRIQSRFRSFHIH